MTQPSIPREPFEIGRQIAVVLAAVVLGMSCESRQEARALYAETAAEACPQERWAVESGGLRQIKGLSWSEHGGLWGAGTGIVRYDFGSAGWQSIALLDGFFFEAIAVDNSGRGWAVGTVWEDDKGPDHAVIVRISDDCVKARVIVPNASLLDIVLGSEEDAWAVGSTWEHNSSPTPLLLHYDGGVWRNHPIDLTVFGDASRPAGAALSPLDSLIIGTVDGVVVELGDDGTWRRIGSLPLGRGEEVGGLEVSGSSVWVVGGRLDHQQRQFVWRFDGTSWRKEVDRDGWALTAAAIDAAADGWVVGYAGAMYRYRDGNLDQLGLTSPWDSATAALRAVVTMRDGTAVAAGDAAQAVRISDRGYSWLHPIRALRAIAADPDNGGPVVVGWRCEPLDCRVSEGRFYPIVWRHERGGWTETGDFLGVSEGTLESVAFASDTGWAVGGAGRPHRNANPTGLILRWTGDVWEVEPSPVPAQLTRIVVSGRRAWAIGVRETPEELRSYVIYTCGDRWCKSRELPGIRLLDIATGAVDSVFVTGEAQPDDGLRTGVLEVFDGTNWEAPVIEGHVESVGAVDVGGDGSGWAFARLSGGGGALLKRLDDGRWTIGQRVDGLFIDVKDLEVASRTEGWAVATDGVVLRLAGARWVVDRPSPRLVGAGVPYEFHNVSLIAPTGGGPEEVWAVGNWQTVLRRRTFPSSELPTTAVMNFRALLPCVHVRSALDEREPHENDL